MFYTYFVHPFEIDKMSHFYPVQYRVPIFLKAFHARSVNKSDFLFLIHILAEMTFLVLILLIDYQNMMMRKMVYLWVKVNYSNLLI